MRWQIQEAKQRFSELVDRAQREGPQVVTKHGREAVVVLAVEEYRRLSEPRADFSAFLTSAPDWPELELERARTPARIVDET